MVPTEWRKICEEVTEAMLAHTRPFVTPLGTETDRAVRLVGTGSYVSRKASRLLVTCQHVACVQPMHYRLHGADDVFEHREAWTMDRHPIDAAITTIGDTAWNACTHRAQAIPFSRFANIHAPADRAELLFFRGFSGENARYAFGVHQTNGTGYCTQEKADAGDAEIFEIFWEPDNTQLSSQTSAEASAEVQFEDAGGFSGSGMIVISA
ncbi:hypothetical protein H4P12_04785 [Paracoccus sp. 11-3]|uniref:Serine protease n=1 Tax=Paracoccus amoyensis TaxID=2760093 RepID=A0A926JC65_9RHOB|nr:hypothetical protein [Paracoccus amoyensis]MBC9246039.1 hypothetical protein [Paracoccus amoyensis]